eukprot:4243506-Prorocentrum_lima.AAC.1
MERRSRNDRMWEQEDSATVNHKKKTRGAGSGENAQLLRASLLHELLTITPLATTYRTFTTGACTA